MNQPVQAQINPFALLGAIIASGNKSLEIQDPEGNKSIVPAATFEHVAETGEVSCIIPLAEYAHFTTPPGYDVAIQSVEIEGGLLAMRIVFTKAVEGRILTPDGRNARLRETGRLW